jgi:hypothetical protein
MHQYGGKQKEGHSRERTDEAHQIAYEQRIARHLIDEIYQQLQQRQLISQEYPIGIHDPDQSVSTIDRWVQMDKRNSNQQSKEENGQQFKPVGQGRGAGSYHRISLLGV